MDVSSWPKERHSFLNLSAKCANQLKIRKLVRRRESCSWAKNLNLEKKIRDVSWPKVVLWSDRNCSKSTGEKYLCDEVFQCPALLTPMLDMRFIRLGTQSKKTRSDLTAIELILFHFPVQALDERRVKSGKTMHHLLQQSCVMDSDGCWDS